MRRQIQGNLQNVCVDEQACFIELVCTCVCVLVRAFVHVHVHECVVCARARMCSHVHGRFVCIPRKVPSRNISVDSFCNQAGP